MTKHLDALLQKEMSRKEFLATMGFGLASVFGFSTIIHLLTGKSYSGTHSIQRSSGYGASKYGR